MGRFYLIVIILAGVMGSVLSSGNSRSSSDGMNGIKERNTDEARAAADWNASAVPVDGVELKRAADGHFYADVEINGMPIKILVDTGASGIALSRDDARRAGLALSAGSGEVVGEGAGGDVRGEWVTLDKVKLGSKTATSVDAVVLNGGEMSLLGQSFLRQFGTVEIRGDTMVLR